MLHCNAKTTSVGASHWFRPSTLRFRVTYTNRLVPKKPWGPNTTPNLPNATTYLPNMTPMLAGRIKVALGPLALGLALAM